jgi:hypothetical protein
MPQFLLYYGDQCSSNFDILSFSTLPDKCLARYALLLALFFVGLFSLISAYVLFADSQYPVLIASLSSFGQSSLNAYQPSGRSYICDSFGTAPTKFFLPDFIPNRWSLGCWAYGSWLEYFRQRGKQLQDPRIRTV